MFNPKGVLMHAWLMFIAIILFASYGFVPAIIIGVLSLVLAVVV